MFNGSSKEVRLELQQFAQGWVIDPRAYPLTKINTELSSYTDHFTNRQCVQLKHFVYSSKPSKETHVVKYPKTWWDGFKLAYPRFCRFFKPVEYTVVTVSWEGRCLFPELGPIREQYKSFMYWDPKPPLVEMLNAK